MTTNAIGLLSTARGQAADELRSRLAGTPGRSALSALSG